MFDTEIIEYKYNRCGRERRSWDGPFPEVFLCKGTVVPINVQKTVWKCSACGIVTEAQEAKE